MAVAAGHDLTADITVARGAIANTAVTAAGSGDSTSITGASIDLTGLGARFNAVALALASQATMASGESLAVKAQIQYSDNDSDWSNYTDVETIYTHTASGAAASGVQRGGLVRVDPSRVGRYLRAIVTPDLSRGGTDTATVAGVWLFGNPDVNE